MSIPSPLQQYHFHVILIWWHSPFKVHIVAARDKQAFKQIGVSELNGPESPDDHTVWIKELFAAGTVKITPIGVRVSRRAIVYRTISVASIEKEPFLIGVWLKKT